MTTVVATGKPVSINARWDGDPPKPGDYLRGLVRPRFAYRIVAIMPTRTARSLTESGRYTFHVERLPAGDVPAGATVHPWKWDSRDPKNTNRRPTWDE